MGDLVVGDFVVAEGVPGGNHIEWDVNTDATIMYYNVYRSVDGGTFTFLDTAENYVRYNSYTQKVAAGVTPYNLFDDYSAIAAGGASCAYKVVAVGAAGTEIDILSDASDTLVSPALDSRVIVPDLPASNTVPAPQSRFWLFALVAGSRDYASAPLDEGINFPFYFGESHTQFVAQILQPCIDFDDRINFIVQHPFGKHPILNVSGSYEVEEHPLGTCQLTTEGGSGNAGATQTTDSNNFYDCAKLAQANPTLYKLLGADAVTAYRALTDQGIHVSMFTTCKLANATTDDDTILGPAFLRIPLAANCGVMVDSSGACSEYMEPRDGNPNYPHGRLQPVVRGAALCRARGVPFTIEPQMWRGDQRHWTGGRYDVGCISLGSRVLYAETQGNALTEQGEFLGGGHLTIMALGSPYWPVSTYADLYTAICTRLAMGHHVAFIGPQQFMSNFTVAEQEHIMDLATSPARFGCTTDASGSLVFQKEFA